MAPEFQQVKLGFAAGFLMLEDIPQADGIALVGEQAPAGRSRVFGNPEFLGQLDLALAAPARNVQQLLPVHPSLFFGDGFRQVFGAQRAQDITFIAGMLGHIV